MDHHGAMLVAALDLMGRPQDTKLIRHEQLAACEILLASPLPSDARVVIRELEQKFRTERTQQ